jgi:hypothetical protein
MRQKKGVFASGIYLLFQTCISTSNKNVDIFIWNPPVNNAILQLGCTK